MKKLFIFLNILLTTCVGWLIYTHVSHTPPPPDKILDMTPIEHSVTKVGIFDKEKASKPGNLSYIYENNIFVENRGAQSEEMVNGSTLSDGPGFKPYTGSFELAGICKMGNTQGAVITGTGSRRSKSLRAKFYRLDQQIGETNYTLVEVSPETRSVVISDGASRSVLELDRNDSASSKRRDSQVKKQEIAAKKAELAFSKTKTKVAVTPPAIKPVAVSTAKPKKKTAEEIAAIRKKILERMAEQKKKKNKSSSKNSRRKR